MTPTSTPTIDPGVPPDPPTGLQARVLSTTAVELSWQRSRGAERYRIQWDAGVDGDIRLSRALALEPRYVDDHLLPGTYRYWVIAEGPGGVSAPASIVVFVPIDFSPTATPASAPRPTATATPTATPTNTPTTQPPNYQTATPTPTPTDDPQGYATTHPTLTPTPEDNDVVVLGLLSHSDFIDPLGDMYVVGEVRNETASNLDRISVRIMFYNHWGTVSRVITGLALMDVIGPRQLMPFAISFPEPSAWESYTVRVTAEPTQREPSAALTIAAYHTYGLETGILHVEGEVVNSGEQTIQRARVVVTLYDPWGTVVNAGFAYTDSIPAGGSAAFDCSFVYYELMETVAVQVEPD